MAAIDTFSQYTGATGAYKNAVAVTPDDDTDLTIASRALWVGGVGNLAVTTLGGDTVTLSAVPAGTLLPLRVSRVLATGTTATVIIALW